MCKYAEEAIGDKQIHVYYWVWHRHSKKYLNLYANGLLAASGDGSPPQ